MVARAPKPQTPLSRPRGTVRRPQQLLASYLGKQPEAELYLEELTVACDCGPIFHRQVYPTGHFVTHACLKCGAVTVARTVGDDGRFTGDAWIGYVAVPTPQAHVDWLARFPRFAIDYSGAPWRWPMSAGLRRYPMLLYPASSRVTDEAELGALEDALWNEQEPLTRPERLRAACGDIPPPPEDLGDGFGGSVLLQRTLDSSPDSDIEVLKARANLLSPASELAAAALLRRAGAAETLLAWLASSDAAAFDAGIAMLRDARALFSEAEATQLGTALLGIMNDLPLGALKDVRRVESWSRFDALLAAIADLGLATPELLAGLAVLQKKLAPLDATVAEAIRIVINELNGIDNRPEQYR